MASRSHAFQAPKGTRDFFPEDMAVRRYLETMWRTVSVRHGFDEVDGPTFEHLDLYTVKSGDGIVSELFSFRRAGGDTDYALRPEFTPTLARMVAARGAQLPKPIRWFSMPSMFRAERPQRGRLREHFQWNVDVFGDPTPRAEADIIDTAVACLRGLGLGPADVRIRLSHREVVSTLLGELGVAAAALPDAFALLDRRDKMPPEVFAERAGALGLEAAALARFLQVTGTAAEPEAFAAIVRDAGFGADLLGQLDELLELLERRGVRDWILIDLGIVRGLAYYTGTVFEVHETSGAERAVAGGGRYDQLVELFGGPPTPAVGFAMGDVVIRLLLEDRNLLEHAATLPRPDAFVVNLRDDQHAALDDVVRRLRDDGFHTRHSDRASRNLGKLLGDANKVHARFAVIAGDEYERNQVVLKDLEGGNQDTLDLSALSAVLAQRLGRPAPAGATSP
jgi:histidyl-tRNA synthetase